MSKPHLAEQWVGSPSKCLVLGNSAVADQIARGLRSEGFETKLQLREGIELPSPLHPDSIAKLKEILKPYAGHFLHPGVSEWATRPELAQLGLDLGIQVVCPPARVMSLFFNKLNLMQMAERLGIPHLVSSFEPIQTVREVEQLLDQLKRQGKKQLFPFILKSVFGSGEGIGIRVIQRMEALDRELPLWLDQLRQRYGEAILYAEEYLEGARYVSVPFARMADGRTHFFPFVDSSLQYRQRKIVEFCPVVGLEANVESRITDWSTKLLDESGFVGVGVLEYLVDGYRAFLIQGLPRLNTGFHLWEKCAGTSAVTWQLQALQSQGNEPLPTTVPDRKWKAGASLRIYAEDSLLQLPQPGVVHEAEFKDDWVGPNSEGSIDLAVLPGESVPTNSEGMVGLITVGAQDREMTLQFSRNILDHLWISGSLQTNERFLAELFDHPWVKEGMFHAAFVDEEFIPHVRPPRQLMDGFNGVCQELSGEKAGKWVVGDQWVKPAGKKNNWKQGPDYFEVRDRKGVSGTLVIDEHPYRVSAYPLSTGRWQVRIGAWTMSVRHVSGKKGQLKLMSLVQGRVHSILFREDTTVPAHEPIVVVESLQSLVPHALPLDIRVNKWNVNAEDEVEMGQELAILSMAQEKE